LLVDSTGRKLEERTVLHSAERVGEFLDWLMKLCNGQPKRAAIAIEVPRGPVVESALERGFPVFSINPKQLDRFRDRYFPSGCKDDAATPSWPRIRCAPTSTVFPKCAPRIRSSCAYGNYPASMMNCV
jgi:hypothetical protein